jgi:ABC-type transport system involved in multi-copper enzyme maturation permease subunit
MMNKFFRDVFVIARNELADSVRSRRAIVVLILFVFGSLLVCNGFVSALHKIEGQLAEMLMLPKAQTPGAVMDSLWQSRHFQRMVKDLLGDRDIATQLMSVHPMALIYGWLAFAFSPVLVMLTASPRIAEELGSGSIRFVMLRTSRGAWCLGKYVGQALMLILALTLSALACWCLMRFRLMGMNSLVVAQGMVIYSWKAWLYSIAYLGLALGISQTTRSQNKAMAMGFGAWMLFAILGVASKHLAGDGWRQLWHGVNMILPYGHRLDLWRLDMVHQVEAATFLITLGVVYLFIGHAFLVRRDV